MDVGVSVLVSAVGRRRYVVEELLAAASEGDVVLVADEDGYAPGLHVPGAVAVAPRAGRSVSSWIDDVQQNHHVDAVLSLHDFDLVHLSEHRSDLENSGVKFIGPPHASAVALIDKLALEQRLLQLAPDLAAGTVPAAQPFIEDGTRYVLKDRFGSGSSGLTAVDSNAARIKAVHKAARRTVWTPSSHAPGELVAQKMLGGIEFNMDLFFDMHGNVRGHCLKEKLSMRGGETDSAHVVLEDHGGLVERIAEAFADMGVVGNVDIDMFVMDGVPSIIDVNPRFGGGYAFSAMSGYRAADGVWKLARGHEIVAYYSPTREALLAKYVAIADIGGV